jgi:hypothetical protein
MTIAVELEQSSANDDRKTVLTQLPVSRAGSTGKVASSTNFTGIDLSLAQKSARIGSRQARVLLDEFSPFSPPEKTRFADDGMRCAPWDYLELCRNPSGSGEYHLTLDPGEKDALAHVPGAGLSLLESMNLSSKAQRFTNSDGTTLPAPIGARPASMNEFERLKLYTDVQRPLRFKDLEAVVTSRIVRNQIPVDYSLEFLRVTGDSVLVPITLQVPNRNLEFRAANGVHSATLDIFARISSMTGRVVHTFEDTVSRDFPDSLFQNSLNLASIYQKAVPLRPGLYKLNVVVKDEASQNVGTIETALRVPQYDEQNLEASSLILADLIEAVPAHQVGFGPFVIGARKIRPRLGKEFSTSEQLGVFLQFYNLKLDSATHKTSTETTFRIMQNGRELWRTGEHLEAADLADEHFDLVRALVVREDAGPAGVRQRVRLRVASCGGPVDSKRADRTGGCARGAVLREFRGVARRCCAGPEQQGSGLVRLRARAQGERRKNRPRLRGAVASARRRKVSRLRRRAAGDLLADEGLRRDERFLRPSLRGGAGRGVPEAGVRLRAGLDSGDSRGGHLPNHAAIIRR